MLVSYHNTIRHNLEYLDLKHYHRESLKTQLSCIFIHGYAVRTHTKLLIYNLAYNEQLLDLQYSL